MYLYAVIGSVMVYCIEVEGDCSDLLICADMEGNIAAAGLIICIQICFFTALSGNIVGVVKSGIQADLR